MNGKWEEALVGTWTIRRRTIPGGVEIKARCSCGDGTVEVTSIPGHGAEKAVAFVMKLHRCPPTRTP